MILHLDVLVEALLQLGLDLLGHFGHFGQQLIHVCAHVLPLLFEHADGPLLECDVSFIDRILNCRCRGNLCCLFFLTNGDGLELGLVLGLCEILLLLLQIIA